MSRHGQRDGARQPDERPPDRYEPAAADADVPEPETDSILRPFIVTGGRTQPVGVRLRVETQVTAAPEAMSAPLSFERRHIVEMCQRPVSVAEISWGLGVPIGVARVLISELVARRLLTVEENPAFGGYPSVALLERIRDGVRAL